LSRGPLGAARFENAPGLLIANCSLRIAHLGKHNEQFARSAEHQKHDEADRDGFLSKVWHGRASSRGERTGQARRGGAMQPHRDCPRKSISLTSGCLRLNTSLRLGSRRLPAAHHLCPSASICGKTKRVLEPENDRFRFSQARVLVASTRGLFTADGRR